MNQIGPRTKFWAEALHELLRVDEVYGVLGAALTEAFEAGRQEGLLALMRGFETREVIDVPFEVIDEKRSAVAADDKELGNEGKLGSTAEVDKSISQGSLQPAGPSAQGDGDPGGDPGSSGEAGSGSEHTKSASECKEGGSLEHPFTD